MVYEETTIVYQCVRLFSSKRIRKKVSYANLTWVKQIEKSFFCGFNLSNHDIISVLCKHVMLRFVTASRSENGCGE